MRVPNRSALVVRPREPYIRWAEHLHGGMPSVSIRSRVAVYLLDEPPVREEGPFLDYFLREIFKFELVASWPDKADWPEDRSAEAFRTWFDVSTELIPVDLGRLPIVVEDM